MRIHKEGYTTILLTFLMIIAAVIVSNVIQEQQTVYHYVLYVFLSILFLFILFFFRSPARKIVTMPGIVLSAADGKVVAVENTTEDEYFHKEMTQISVFMSPLKTHLNRYPVSGIIDYVKHSPGKYFIAWLPKSSELNERNSVAITAENQKPILVRQIAGAVARRIVSYSRPGDMVQQGEELGFIKFGSRVDLFVPVDAEIIVKTGDNVKAGKTVIAKF